MLEPRSEVLFSKTEAPQGAALEGSDVSPGIALEEVAASPEISLRETEPSGSTPAKFTYSLEIQQLQIEQSRKSFNESASPDHPEIQD